MLDVDLQLAAWPFLIEDGQRRRHREQQGHHDAGPRGGPEQPPAGPLPPVPVLLRLFQRLPEQLGHPERLARPGRRPRQGRTLDRRGPQGQIDLAEGLPAPPFPRVTGTPGSGRRSRACAFSMRSIQSIVASCGPASRSHLVRTRKTGRPLVSMRGAGLLQLGQESAKDLELLVQLGRRRAGVHGQDQAVGPIQLALQQRVRARRLRVLAQEGVGHLAAAIDELGGDRPGFLRDW